MCRNFTLIIFLFLILSPIFSQHDLGELIPENTATHIAIKNGSWFSGGTWNTGTIPGDAAIVHIPASISVTYEGQSTSHIFAIRVDGSFICTQTDSNNSTSLTFDTFIGTHMSHVQFLANEDTDGEIEVNIAPFDIQAHKNGTSGQSWNASATSHFSDANPVDQVVRKHTGGKRYNSYEEALAGDTAITEESRTPYNDGIGVTGRYIWDPKQLSLGLVVMGQLEIIGQEKTNMVKLGADAMSGQKQLTLSSAPVGWKKDDTIIITRGGNKNPTNNGEDERIIDVIDGTSITTTRNLNKNHQGKIQDNLHCYVGNLTRNITFKSSSPDAIHERGHLMAMHNDTNIQIKNAAFVDMGRTDKSRLLDDRIWDSWIQPQVFKSKNSALGQECAQMVDAPARDITNHRGRYSIHLHKTGAKLGAKTTQVTGNVVWGNPGWGITHHDSHANISQNVVYNVTGSGIVSETGSETGFWDNNLVVKTSKGHSEDVYISALFHDDYLFSGQGLGMKGRAVVCRGNVIANAIQGVGIMNMNPVINSVDRVDPLQLATVRPGFEVDQFPLSVNGYSKEGDGVMPVEVALIMENTTIIWTNLGLKSIERDMGVNHESRSVFDGFKVWGANQGLSITYQADYTFHDVFISGKNDTSLGAYLWKHSHNHVFDGIKLVDLEYGITVSKLVESGNGELKTRNNGFTPWYFIDLETENVSNFYEIVKEDPATATVYTEHSDNPIHASSSDFVMRPVTFTLADDADLEVDYAANDFKFEIDGMITDQLGSYNFGIRQALAQGTLREGYPERIYEFASASKFVEYLTNNGVYQHPFEDYLYFILQEQIPDRLSSKYTSFPIRIKINNPPTSGIFTSPQQEPLSNFAPQNQLVSLAVNVSQSSTATGVTYDSYAIDCGPHKAIDKNTNGRINAQIFQRGLVPLGSFSQTQVENEPWYDLDLGELKTIDFIDIWNTVELNGAAIETVSTHFKDFYVLISENPFDNMTLTEARANADYEYVKDANPTRKFSLNNLDINGRYIRIQATGNTVIKLAEVEVIGRTNKCLLDVVPPVALARDVEITLNEHGEAIIQEADINDGSTDDCTIASISLDKTTFSCADVGENTVTLTVTDNSGNTHAAIATILVKSLPPVIDCPTETLMEIVDGNNSFEIPDYSYMVTDDCKSISQLAIVQQPVAGTMVTGPSFTSINLSVTDESDSTVFCSFDLQVDQVLSINDINQLENDILLFPNPTESDVTIKSEVSKIELVEVYDLKGRLLKRIPLSSGEVYQIHLEDLANSMYFIKVSTKNKSFFRRVEKR
ncbi:T9SS type A sorting domain-containing protein [uncultured Aquimarina sp.]|uniref:T9SS type A sorting domain-containing protein n=1 Tax=uncultured Aquimarina sp. TaxID=575652 RepID=UPI0026141F63|nr:T9SS type A sorting domain-containing protein [uncultured Aquimarina sp.]